VLLCYVHTCTEHSQHWIDGSERLDRGPGVSTVSWDVTGVLAEGGVPIDERSESVLPLSTPQAKKILGSKVVLLDF
jgi:hypothetical protein